MSDFIKDEKNQIEFFMSRRYIKLCFIITILIMGCIGIFNCLYVEVAENKQNTFWEYLILFGTIFIGIFPMIVSFVNDTKNGYYVSFILNMIFLVLTPIEEGDFWYIFILISVPILAIIRFVLDLAHHTIRIKPDKDIDDPYEKYPYNELDSSDSSHDSGDDGGGDDEMSGEGDIDIEGWLNRNNKADK